MQDEPSALPDSNSSPAIGDPDVSEMLFAPAVHPNMGADENQQPLYKDEFAKSGQTNAMGSLTRDEIAMMRYEEQLRRQQESGEELAAVEKYVTNAEQYYL